MSRRKQGSKRQPFPRRRPKIAISPSKARSFAVDIRQLPWWNVAPVLGQRALSAFYDPPGWTLTSVDDMRVVRPARIHDLDGVEIEKHEWEPDTGWQLDTWRIFGRLTDSAVQWLATLHVRDRKQVLYTFLDEGFDEDFGQMPRRLEDRGRFVLQADGTYKQKRTRRAQAPGATGAGIWRVRVGRRAFTCLRVLETGNGRLSAKGILYEAYLTRRGLTVLGRRYNGRLWAVPSRWTDRPWDEKFPDHNRIVIDGCVFVHWYDVLTNLACGIK